MLPLSSSQRSAHQYLNKAQWLPATTADSASSELDHLRLQVWALRSRDLQLKNLPSDQVSPPDGTKLWMLAANQLFLAQLQQRSATGQAATPSPASL